MEAREQTVARLVLGYLRSEKCFKAYNEFLKSSRHLLQYRDNIVKSKYIPTRFNGLSLESILRDYFECYQTIQGRLEVTNYFNEVHPEVGLEKQLTYLLNRVESSRTSTPALNGMPRSSDSEEDISSSVDMYNDSDGSPICKLPDRVNNNQPKREALYTVGLSKSHPVDRVKERNEQAIINTEILRDTLLEKPEFQAKIAENINNSRQADTQQFDLNETIKCVIAQTEKDPVFKHILDEMLSDSANINDDNEISMDSEDTSNKESYPKRRHKRKKPNPLGQNAETQTENVGPTNEIPSFNSNLSAINVLSNTAPTSNQLYLDAAGNLVMVPPSIPPTGITYSPSQYYLVNKNMIDCHSCIKEKNTLQLSTVIPNDDKADKTNLPSTSTPVPVRIKQQIAATSVSKSKLLLEKCTPSVHNKSVTQSAVKEYFDRNSRIKNYPNTLTAPKPTIHGKAVVGDVERASLDIEQITKTTTKTDKLKYLYDCVNSNKTEQNLEHSSVSKTKPLELNVLSGSAGTETHTFDISDVIDESTHDQNKINNNNTTKVVSSEDTKLCANKCDGAVKDMPEQDGKKMLLPVSKSPSVSLIKSDSDQSRRKTMLITPLQRNPLKKGTPKSTSHVRNLDFSTPYKKSATQTNHKENESKVHATKMLFKSETTVDVKKPWDADLRVCIQTDEEVIPPKRKRKSAGDKTAPVTKKCKSAKKEKKCKSEVGPLLEENVPVSRKENEEMFEKKDETLCKIILSPSKYNANKRALVGESSKMIFTTPETAEQKKLKSFNIKPSCVVMTPLKGHIKTPGTTTPAETTPFTKMLEANITTMDIDNIATPSISFAPNFPPFTPTVDLLSPYQNRHTDYSTDSYYQPSDNEVNSSVEKQATHVEKNTQPKPQTLNEENLCQKCSQLSGDADMEETKVVCNSTKSPVEKRTTRQSLRQINAKNKSTDQDKKDNEKTDNDAKKKLNKKKNRNTRGKKKTTSKRKRSTGGLINVQSTKSNEGDDDTFSEPNSSQIELMQEEKLKTPDKEEPKAKKPQIKPMTNANESNEAEIENSGTNLSKDQVKQEDEPKGETGEFKLITKADKNGFHNLYATQTNSSEIEPEGDFGKSSIQNKKFQRGETCSSKTTKMQLSTEPKVFKHFKTDLNLSSSTSESDEVGSEYTVNDVGDQCLIPWLKERGIHLMQNKEKQGTKKEDRPQINISDISKEVSYSIKETLDTETFGEPNACYVFDETTERPTEEKGLDKFKKISVCTARIYIGELDTEVGITLIHSKLFSLIEIRGENFKEKDSPRSDQNKLDNANDDVLLSPDDDTNERLNVYEGVKDTSTQAKSLLQGLNVDTFLNNIHGNSSSEF